MKFTRREVLIGLGGTAAGFALSKGISVLTKEQEYELGKYGPIELIVLEAEKKGEGVFNPSISEDGSTICYFEGNPEVAIKFGDSVRYTYDHAQLSIVEGITKKRHRLSPPNGWEWDSKVTPSLTDRHLAVALYQFDAQPHGLLPAQSVAAAFNDNRDGKGAIAIYDIVSGKMVRVIPLEDGQRVTTLKSSNEHLAAGIETDVGTLQGLLEGRLYNLFRSEKPRIFCESLDNCKNNDGDVIDIFERNLVFIKLQRIEDHRIVKNVVVYNIDTDQISAVTQNPPQEYIDEGPREIKISKGGIFYLEVPIHGSSGHRRPFLPRYVSRQIDTKCNVVDYSENDPEKALAEWLSQGHEAYDSFDVVNIGREGGIFAVNYFSRIVDLMTTNGHNPLRIPERGSYTHIITAHAELKAVFSTSMGEEEKRDKVFVVKYKSG